MHIVKGIKTLIDIEVVKNLRKTIEKKEVLLIDYYTLPNYKNCFKPKVAEIHQFKNFNTILYIDDKTNKNIEVRNLLETDENNIKYITVLPHNKPHMCPVKAQRYYDELHIFKYYRNILVPIFVDIKKLHQDVPIIPLISASSESSKAGPLSKAEASLEAAVARSFELKYLKYKYKYLRLKMLKN